MGKNEQQWSSATPGLLIILLDQSGSMLQQHERSDGRLVFASCAINVCINHIADKLLDGDAPRNHCYISVIGYNRDVNYLCSDWIKDLYNNPLRYDKLKKRCQMEKVAL